MALIINDLNKVENMAAIVLRRILYLNDGARLSLNFDKKKLKAIRSIAEVNNAKISWIQLFDQRNLVPEVSSFLFVDDLSVWLWTFMIITL
jgi:hypothetical protein